MKKIPLLLAAGAIVALTSTGASAASLITNGTFDTGLAPWGQTGGPGVTWDSVAKAANLGQVGTPGTSTLRQSFILNNPNVAGSFKFTWQNEAQLNTDIFSVVLKYTTIGGGVDGGTLALIAPQGSNPPTVFGAPYAPTFSFTAGDFAADFVAGTAQLVFKLKENNSPVGTYIAIDDVKLTSVPLPTAAWLFGSALLGLVTVARRKATSVAA